MSGKQDNPRSIRDRSLAAYPWIAFVLPLAVFMLVGSLETTQDSGPKFFGLIHYGHYPLVYTAKIILTTLALAFVWPGYRLFPCRISPLAIAVGIVGVVLWVVIVDLQIEQKLPLEWLTGNGQRSAFNPLEHFANQPSLGYAFLAVRLFGLALVVAIAEEMLLRGFLMRYIQNPDAWQQVSFANLGWPALIAGTAAAMLSHPGELLAALVWFSLVSWLLVRTGNIWNCIVAHMTTNLLLGLYVLYSGKWYFM